MPKVSIIIPSRGEKPENLGRTLKSIYDNAAGDFEVIVGLNGQPWTEIESYPNLRIIRLDENIGVKGMINLLALSAKGDYIYKSDAHCSFGKGFDEILKADMEDDWIVMPRFYVLDGKTWEWQDDRHYDYFYLCCPFTDPKGFRFKAGGHWPERTVERENNPELMIDETPQIHGSGWFITKKKFFELGGFPNIDPNGHGQEPIWLALKNWLMGGRVMVNKNTWYAHMHQDGSVKGYRYTKEEERYTYAMTANHWMLDKEPNLKYDIEWFIEKFYPMPTWLEDWRKQLENYRALSIEGRSER
jgi:glycosyltransferase involved in cell wall biosynthesis